MNTEYNPNLEIRSDVPFPAQKIPHGEGQKVIRAVLAMKVGESTVVPMWVAMQARMKGKVAGMSFTTRQVEGKTYRIWRLS